MFSREKTHVVRFEYTQSGGRADPDISEDILTETCGIAIRSIRDNEKTVSHRLR
jgi:hypothetical protein